MIKALPDEPETDFSGVASELEKLLIHQSIATGIAEIESGQGFSQEDIGDSIETWAAEA